MKLILFTQILILGPSFSSESFTAFLSYKNNFRSLDFSKSLQCESSLQEFVFFTLANFNDL